MEIAAIVAMSRNNVIGQQQELPWHLPADLQFFKQTTSHAAVLMGRVTYESIGRPLPNRYNLVLSSQADFTAAGCETVTDLPSAFAKAAAKGYDKLFVIGGAKVYALAQPYIHRWYITHIHEDVVGDTYLEIQPQNWTKVQEVFRPKDEKNKFDMTFATYQVTTQ